MHYPRLLAGAAHPSGEVRRLLVRLRRSVFYHVGDELAQSHTRLAARNDTLAAPEDTSHGGQQGMKGQQGIRFRRAVLYLVGHEISYSHAHLAAPKGTSIWAI
jgi:hypothetical protein